MKKTLKFSLYLAYLAAVMLMLLLAGSEYSWMQDVNPAINTARLSDDTDDRGVVRGLALGIAMVLMLSAAALGDTARQRATPGLLALAAIAVFLASR